MNKEKVVEILHLFLQVNNYSFDEKMNICKAKGDKK